MTRKYRQEVLNVLLAQLLQERGVIAAPESIISNNVGRKIPDVIVNFMGLRTVIEGEVNDQPKAKEKAVSSARKRVEDGIAHIGVAVIYPSEIRNIEFSSLKNKLADSHLQFAIVSESEETGFVTGNVDYLKRALPYVFEHLAQEDIVKKAVNVLEDGINKYAHLLITSIGNVERVAKVLGIHKLDVG